MAEDEYKPILNDELLSWIERENEPETADVALPEIQRYANAVALRGQTPSASMRSRRRRARTAA